MSNNELVSLQMRLYYIANMIHCYFHDYSFIAISVCVFNHFFIAGQNAQHLKLKEIFIWVIALEISVYSWLAAKQNWRGEKGLNKEKLLML